MLWVVYSGCTFANRFEANVLSKAGCEKRKKSSCFVIVFCSTFALAFEGV